MKVSRCLPPVLMAFFISFMGLPMAGCSRSEQKSVVTTVKTELNLLKAMDSKTAAKYVSSLKDSLGSPDDGDPLIQDSSLAGTIEEVVALFFQNFGYKILSTQISEAETEASCSLSVKTINAHALAKDYVTASLKAQMKRSLLGGVSEDASYSLPVADRFLILRNLLRNEQYGTMDNICQIHLKKNDSDGSWQIVQDSSLENSLTGGFEASLSNPALLTPAETLSAIFDGLMEMDQDDFVHYLGAYDLLYTTDDTANSIAAALSKQIHTCFSYEILQTEESGVQADVHVRIQTFDGEAILSSYKSSLEAYLDTAQAVINGRHVRYQKSYSLLVDAISKNEAVLYSETVFHLINDGVSWKLQEGARPFSEAVFGKLFDAFESTEFQADYYTDDSQETEEYYYDETDEMY
ncbi:MAG: hypothetical protein IKD86_03740 [Firmicutes bacterium]|nr:hypothetical protein [Bacillota bacterium]